MAAAVLFECMPSRPGLSLGLADPALSASWEALEKVGEGATSVVWRARQRDGTRLVALKVAKDEPGSSVLAREALLLSQVGRRWGAKLADFGRGYVANEWVPGVPLSLRQGTGAERTHDDHVAHVEKAAAVVAHAVARALEELHQAGVVHGDVKPANVLVSGHAPRRDAAEDRGATLIDLGLAGALGQGPFGYTPRYAAPELREGGETGPSADLWSLGVVLAEVLDPRAADSEDPTAVVARWDLHLPGEKGERRGEPYRWAEALLAVAPGGRPSASWVARRAARWLELAEDEREAGEARVARVRRTYLAERSRDLALGAAVSPRISDPARGWLQEALAASAKLAVEEGAARGDVGTRVLEPMGALRRARWLVSLVGLSAADWPVGGDDQDEGELAARASLLARLRDPSSWTQEDLESAGQGEPVGDGWNGLPAAPREERLTRLMRELGRARPSPAALALAEDEIARGTAPAALAVQLATSLLRGGEPGRAWAAIAGGAEGAEGERAEAGALRAEAARRRGDTEEAARAAESVLSSFPSYGPARATLARLAWDRGDLDGAERLLEGAQGPAAAEVRALVAWRRGAGEAALRKLSSELAKPLDADAYARLEATRGLLEHARGSSAAAARSFGRAVELASRAGAVVEEATYLTNEAAAAADGGEIARALASATRAALLWERIGKGGSAARAWLARAACLATVGAAHATDEAATEARHRALASRDTRAAAYARWAQVEVRAPGDAMAGTWAMEADEALRTASREDRARSCARLLVWAPGAVDAARIGEADEQASSGEPAARWEWWGARAFAIVAGRASPGDEKVLACLLALLDVPAALGSRGPALDAGVRLALARQDGDAARRLDQARLAASRALRDGTPPEYQASLSSVSWARASSLEVSDVAFQPAQVAQLESIVRALSSRDRLRPLLEQVLDTMILWTGVERGLLLLRAPDGRLVPRAARNLARRDLTGDQLTLSQTIARRALAEGDAIVATDALTAFGDLHASVHALKLRSVLAVPLVARGEPLGVVYLDDRVRKGAFGLRELAWVRVVASQAAMAVADARDAVLLRRAARRAERARTRVEALLAERETELSTTRAQLALVRQQPSETRYRYDDIVGRSEAMRQLLHVVDRVTTSDVPVLIVGESGTGKELVARAIHKNGPRARRAFVSENCASVPETLLESTLFGHVKGAFTGASAAHAGLLEVADGGTLFLDEIGEMSLAMQVKLLRALQDGEVRAVGGERIRKVNVRVIGATHRDLDALVAAGRFREDLLYRLNVIALRVPALRDRADDLPSLIEHFVHKHAGDRKVRVTRAALARLTAFSWPGNVRQLENEVRRALVLGEDTIDVGDLSPEIARGSAAPRPATGLHLRSRVDALEAELVTEALTKTRGNQTKAAHLLGLSRFGLQKMVKRLGIKATT